MPFSTIFLKIKSNENYASFGIIQSYRKIFIWNIEFLIARNIEILCVFISIGKYSKVTEIMELLKVIEKFLIARNIKIAILYDIPQNQSKKIMQLYSNL